MLQKSVQNTIYNPAFGLSMMMMTNAQPAYAKGGEYGCLECVPEALIHPVIMFGLLMASVFAAVEGWNWRTIRTDDTSKQIKALKAKIDELSGSEEDVKSNSAKIKGFESEIKEL